MMRVLHGLLCAGTALMLVVPGVYVAAPAVLSVAGLFFIQRATRLSPLTDPAIRSSWQALLGGFAAFAVSGLLLNIYHGDSDPGAYERLFPFIFLPAMAWTIRAGGWSALPWIASLCLAAILSGTYALWEYLADPSVRATGATGNAIKFGHTAALLAGLNIIAALFYPFPARKGFWRTTLVVAALFAAQASILSGSKGGWPVLLAILAIIPFAAIRRTHLKERLLLVLAPVVAVSVALAFAPTQMMKDRIMSGINGAEHWFESGGEVTEGSVSIRFQLWSVGWQIFSENPVFGAGIEAKATRWKELVSAEDIASTVGILDTTSAHNDLIDTLAQGGLIGLAGHGLAFLGVWVAFWRLARHPDCAVATLARMGLFTVFAYLTFGVAVSVFWMSIFRSTFAAFSLILLSLITVRLAKEREIFKEERYDPPGFRQMSEARS